MRFAGSVYDLDRQRGLRLSFSDLSEREMRRRLLARLRFDDMLACDDPSKQEESRIVLSASDVIEGPLFVTLQPKDLTGVGLEVCAPASVVDAGQVVTRLVRSWIQDENGVGRPFILNLLLDDDERIMLRQAVAGRRGLNVRTIDQAAALIRSAGILPERVSLVREHWYKWEEILAKSHNESAGGPRLTAFRKHASAVGMLKALRVGRLRALGLSREVGIPFFKEALARLVEEKGRRDAVAGYFDEQSRALYSPADRGQLAVVRGVFFHEMFRAVAKSNRAIDEHSASVGHQDVWAFEEDKLDIAMMSALDSIYEIDLPAKIVSGLGDLSGTEYAVIRIAHRPAIAVGMSEFLRVRRTDALERALERLARDVLADRDRDEAHEGIRRTIVFPLLQVALRIAATVGGGELGSRVPEVGQGWGTALGAAAEGMVEVGQKVTEGSSRRARSWMLKKSLLRRIRHERGPRG